MGLASGIVAVLLIGLIVARELLRAYGEEDAEPLTRGLNYVIAPLLVLFAILIAIRLLG